MTVIRASNIFDEVTEFFAQGSQDLIFVLHRFYNAVSVRKRKMCENIPSKNGISSSLVRSAPSASAIVDRRRMAFNRSRTSSCCAECQNVSRRCLWWSSTFNSSMSTAIG
jgi:hypothetical protein